MAIDPFQIGFQSAQNALSNVQAGMDFANNAFAQSARSRYSRGDQNALNELMRYDPQAAMSLGAYEQQKKQWGQADQQRQARANALGLVGRGDINGAQNALAQTGDIEGLDAIKRWAATATEQQYKQFEREVKNGWALNSTLEKIPEAQRQAWVQQNAQSLVANGYDPSKITPDQLSDASIQINKRRAEAYGLAGKEAYEGVNLGNGGFGRFNNMTGTFDVLREPERKPEYMKVENGDGSTSIVQVGPGGVGGSTQGANQVGAYQPNQGTRAQRNNNPGNLRADGRSQWQGMTGVDDGGFVVFDTPENGQRAAGINLANQTRLHGINTLRGLISKYAPASDSNDTEAYIQSVAAQTGINPDQEVNFADPNVQSRVLPAMFKVEGGGTPARAPEPPRSGVTSGRPGEIFRSQGYSGGQNPKEARADRKDESAIRREFNALPDVKEFNGVATSYDRLTRLVQSQNATAAPTPAADMAIIFSYMKMLDPTSVVREGEYATVQNAGSLPTRLVNMYNKAVQGTNLTKSQRDEILRASKTQFDASSTRYNELVSQYRSELEYQGLNPDAIQPRKAGVPKPQAKTAVAGQGARQSGYTDAQRRTQKSLTGGGEAAGSQGNPFMLRSPEELEYLKRNKAAYGGEVYFIAPDGSVRRVP